MHLLLATLIKCKPNHNIFILVGSSTATTAAPTSEPPSYSTTKAPARVQDTKSIFNQAQAKPSQSNPNVKSSETGEEGVANNIIELKKEDKPITNMFGSKASLSSNLIKPTEQKPQETPKIEHKAPIKVILKAAEKAKENVPEKVAESILQEPQKIEKKEPEIKPLSQQSFNIGSTSVTTATVTSTSMYFINLFYPLSNPQNYMCNLFFR